MVVPDFELICEIMFHCRSSVSNSSNNSAIYIYIYIYINITNEKEAAKRLYSSEEVVYTSNETKEKNNR